MNECIACGATDSLCRDFGYEKFCRDCADLATSDVEGASYVRGMVMARRGFPLSDPWDKVKP